MSDVTSCGHAHATGINYATSKYVNTFLTVARDHPAMVLSVLCRCRVYRVTRAVFAAISTRECQQVLEQACGVLCFVAGTDRDGPDDAEVCRQYLAARAK